MTGRQHALMAYMLCKHALVLIEANMHLPQDTIISSDRYIIDNDSL